jgi:hypothetical protein
MLYIEPAKPDIEARWAAPESQRITLTLLAKLIGILFVTLFICYLS